MSLEHSFIELNDSGRFKGNKRQECPASTREVLKKMQAEMSWKYMVEVRPGRSIHREDRSGGNDRAMYNALR